VCQSWDLRAALKERKSSQKLSSGIQVPDQRPENGLSVGRVIAEEKYTFLESAFESHSFLDEFICNVHLILRASIDAY
jgi:hypothetical protein